MKIKYDKPINNLIFFDFSIILDVNDKIFYLLFIYLITIKSEIYLKFNHILWKEHINHQKLKEPENMDLGLKWKLKVVKNFWLEDEREVENR